LFDAPITPRVKTAKAEQQQQAIKTIKQQQSAEQAEREERAENIKAIFESGKTPYMLYYEELQRKAEAGDLQAAELVRRNKTTYEMHAQSIREQQEKANN
jgi:regulator of protease activity HflC (stomatin/prohibitin superfamily)